MKFAAFAFTVLSLSCVSAKGLARGRTRGNDSSQPIVVKSTTPRGLQGSQPIVVKSTTPRGLQGMMSGSNDNTNPCDICGNGGRPDSLRLRYELPSATSTLQGDKATCVQRSNPDYPETTLLTVSGSDAVSITNGTEFLIEQAGGLETNTDFEFVGNSGFDCSIHTSCSAPLVPGDKIGPFLVIGEEDCDPIPDECIICDQENKQRPDELSFIYNSTGVNSAYQDEDKATCRADTYPSNPTTITALDKSGNVLGVFFDISDGDSFTVFAADGDTLDSITTFAISGWDNGDGGDDCFIHTSCSQPLVQDDQIGPFIVTAGNDCFLTSPVPSAAPTLPPCIVPDKATYLCNETITVGFNFEGSEGQQPLFDDWVGIYPCDTVEFKHAEVWQYTCGPPDQTPFDDNNDMCMDGPQSEGVIVFDSLPIYDEFGPHEWPVAPFYVDASQTDINTCFQAVLLRFEGPSVPPYTSICESVRFEISQNDADPDCAVRPDSPSIPSGAAPAPTVN